VDISLNFRANGGLKLVRELILEAREIKGIRDGRYELS
jgi:hypothetical protein